MNLACLFSLSLACLGPGSGSMGDVLEPVAYAQAPDDDEYKPKASEVLVLVQAFYNGTKDLKADFKQTYYNPSFASKTIKSGELTLKQPGRMIWNYQGKSDSDFYANGDEMVMVEHGTRQVIRSSIEKNGDLSAAMKFLFGGQSLTREFRVKFADEGRIKKYGTKHTHVVMLQPKKKNKHYKGLLLVVDDTTGRVKKFVVYNHDKSTNLFELSQMVTNTGLEDGAFSFKTPKGYVESEE